MSEERLGGAVIEIRFDDSGLQAQGTDAGKDFTRGFDSGTRGLGGGTATSVGKGDYGKAGKSGGSVFGKAFGFAAAGLATVGIGSFLKGAVGDARENQKVQAATQAIIKATGSAARLTTGDIQDLTGALAAKTGVDDAQIQKGTNLLLTFKNVKKAGEGLDDVFGRATKAGLDLAAAGFGSVEGNALQLGKALNDPLKGITALGRSGVTFTEVQKEQIKGYVESNDLLSAQKIILGEVEAQVGGTAEATATAGEKAAFAFGEIKETIGTLLLPVLDTLADVFVNKIAPAIQDVLAGTSPLTPIFNGIASAVGFVGSAISSAFSGGGAGAGLISQVSDTLKDVAVAVLPQVKDALADILPVLGTLFTSLKDVAVAVFPQVRAAISAIVPVLGQLFTSLKDALGDVLPVMADTFQNKILPAARSLFDYFAANVIPVLVQVGQIVATQVIPLIASLAQYFYGTLYPAVIDIVTAVATRLKPVFDQLITTFRTQVLPTISRLIDQIRNELIPALQPIIAVVIRVIGALLKFAAAILAKVYPPLIRISGFIFSKVIPAIVKIVTVVANVITFLGRLGGAIGSAIGRLVAFQTGLVRLATQGIQRVVTAVTSLPGKIIGLAGKMVNAGKEFIGGLFEGIKSAATGVGGLVSNIAESILTAIKSLLNGLINTVNDAIPNKIAIPAAPDIDLPDNPIPNFGRGGVVNRATLGVFGERGTEALVPLTPGAPLASGVLDAIRTFAIERGIAGGPTINIYPVTDNPEAIALAVVDRLVTV